jgi:predicted dehydrogenase
MNNYNNSKKNILTRRNFMKKSVQAGAATMLAGNSFVFAGASDTVRVGLIGTGGRGTGAGIIDCAESSKGIELVAMGDLFQDHIDNAPDRIKANLEKRNLSVGDIYKINPKTTFVGFDAYQKVIDSGVDMVILTSPPNFRPMHLQAAVEAGKHVFMEKPVAVDPVGVRSVIESSKIAKQKGLTIVAGTQMRRSLLLRETIRRIHEGAIGDIVAGQCYRSGGAMRNWRTQEKVKKNEWSEMEYQIRRWLFWTWLSGDFIVEMHVHNLDVVNWVLNAHPVACVGLGGRQSRTGMEYGNVFDHFSVEYTYPDDVRIEYMGTQIDNYAWRGDQRVAGTKGSALLDFRNGIIKGSNPFTFEGESPNPSVLQYKEMIDSIRNGDALNEGKQIAESTMTAVMGRMSAYTGQTLEWDWALNESKLDLTPGNIGFGDMERRPVAVPGVTKLI